MIAVFSVRTKIIYFLNIFKFCDNGLVLTWFLAKTDRQKNIKLSDGNTNNSSIIIKTRPFQQKQIYEIWITHWKILASKRLKMFLMRPCKKYLTYDNNFGYTIIFFKNISKFCDNGSIFEWFIVWTSAQTIGQAWNYRLTALLITVSPRKRNLSKNNSGNNKKWKLEHLFKS